MRRAIHRAALTSAATGILSILLYASVGAQERPAPISLEARGGYSLPGSALNDRGAQSDFGYGLSAILGLSPAFGIYGGWARDVFHCKNCGPNHEIVASGVEVGGKFIVADRVRAHPWVKGGVIVSRSLLRSGTSEFKSSRHVGFQGSLGLDAPLGEMISVSPSVRLNNFTSEFDGLDGTFAAYQPRTDFRFLSFDLGVQIHLR